LFVTTKLRFEQGEDIEVLVVPVLAGLGVGVVPLLVGVELVLVELLEVLVDVDELDDVDELEVDVVLDDTVEPEPPVRSTINVSMRVEQPNDESDPSFPSQ
jgi:hypothetical protein